MASSKPQLLSINLFFQVKDPILLYVGMSALISLPVYFLRFWYLEVPSRMLDYFLTLNQAFFQLFSLPLFVRTFFLPLKNEYRKGLVGFSLGMGIAVKLLLIIVDVLLFLLLLLLELVLIAGFMLFPILTLLILIW